MGLIRTTFIIDGNGIVAGVIEKPKAKEHAQEILKAMGS
jgi:peroxiredoxin Q/BCP